MGVLGAWAGLRNTSLQLFMRSAERCKFGWQNGEGVLSVDLNEHFFLLGVVTFVPILVKIDQEMRP